MSSIAKTRAVVALGAVLGTFAASVPQASAAPRAAHVRIADLAFVPNVVHVRVGQPVVWTNEDQVVHTVTSGKTSDTNRWKSSDPLPQGASFTVVLAKPGTYDYFCKPHFYDAAMHARIVVDR